MKKLKEAEKDSSAIKINRNRNSGKKKIDLFARLRNDEHPIDDLFHAESDYLGPLQTSPNPSNLIQSNPIPSNVNPSNENRHKNTPTSPEKDFQKVPNSLTRNAIPDKLFIGTSKYTYDALYLKTRGAVKPQRTVKATKRELMTWIGISDVTLFKHIKHLQSVGLLKAEFRLGSHEGATYEVFIPEEIKPLQTPPNPSNVIQSKDIQSNVIESKKVGGDLSKKVGEDWMGNPNANKDTCEIPKTSLKTNTNDDEPYAAMSEVFDSLHEQATGKKAGKRDRVAWKEFAELIKTEFDLAASKTTVSNVPAFLIEHFRRKLFSSATKPATSTSKSKSLITKTGFDREKELETLRDIYSDGGLEEIEKWRENYSAEDWQYFITELEK